MSTPDSNLQIRPRFREHTELPQEEVKKRISSVLTNKRELWRGEIVDNHVIVKVPKAQQHYWSPQLTLQLEACSISHIRPYHLKQARVALAWWPDTARRFGRYTGTRHNTIAAISPTAETFTIACPYTIFIVTITR